MGRWIHRLSDVDLTTMRATCSECGPVTVYRSGNGVRCSTSKQQSNARYVANGGTRATPNIRRKHAAEVGHCEACGFVPAATCQLDVDHRDGDWKNDRSNWTVLCANCHRLKTYELLIFTRLYPALV